MAKRSMAAYTLYTFSSHGVSSISDTIPIQYRSSYLQKMYVVILIRSRQGFWAEVCFPRKLKSDSNSLSSDTFFILIEDVDVGKIDDSFMCQVLFKPKKIDLLAYSV